MNEANTQAGQNAQSLQPGASQTQAAASGLQNGSGAGLGNSNTSDLLNEGSNAGNLSVGVAGTSSRTSTEIVAQTPENNSFSPMLFLVLLFLFLIGTLLMAYRRLRKFDEDSHKANNAEAELLDEVSWVTKDETKKKRKKPKKPHHH